MSWAKAFPVVVVTASGSHVDSRPSDNEVGPKVTRNRVMLIGSVMLLIGFVALSLSSLTIRVGDGVSGWDMAFAVVFVLGTIGFVLNVERWRSRATTDSSAPPATVDESDVDAAIACTSDRVDAVRALRERYPALGLGDAARLVDERRAT